MISNVEVETMEKIVEQGLLYDFYGELLTPHQQKIYEAVVYNDMSLSEIALEEGISRQGVHDLLKRCDRILSEYEEKLQLLHKFTLAKEHIAIIMDVSSEENNDLNSLNENMKQIRVIAQKLLEEL